MSPAEHKLHEVPHGDDVLFDVCGECSDGRAPSGSVKPDLTTAVTLQCVSPLSPSFHSHFFHTSFQADSSFFSKLSLKFPRYCLIHDGLSSPSTPTVGGWWSPSSLTWSVNINKCPPDSFVYSTRVAKHLHSYFKTVVNIHLFSGYFYCLM